MTSATTIMDLMRRRSESFAILMRAIQAAGLEQLFGGPDPLLTLFAPSDAAWRKLPPSTLTELFNDPELLRSVIENHVVKGALSENELRRRPSVTTLQGSTLTLHSSTSPLLKIGNAQIELEKPFAPASNGYVYAIDTVLLHVAPPAPEPPADPLPQEVWVPYATGALLPSIIGDAELIFRDELVLKGVEALANLLVHYGVTLNTARAVRLEEHGETTYNVPRGPAPERRMAGEFPALQVLGMIIVVSTNSATKVQGAYLELLRGVSAERTKELLAGAEPAQVAAILSNESSLWERVLIDAQNAEKDFSLALVQTGATSADEVPSSGIWYGSKRCKQVDGNISYCRQCEWYENVPWVPACV